MPEFPCAICGSTISDMPASDDDALTAEHVIPSAWYPETTPASVQRWTVPSHRRCNNAFSADESYALQSLSATIDTSHQAAAGVWERVLRGVQQQAGKNERDKRARQNAFEKLMARTARADSISKGTLKSAIRSLTNAAPAEAVIHIEMDRINRVLEKIGKCVIYKLTGAPPPVEAYLRARTVPPDDLVEAWQTRGRSLIWHDLGPGCKIGRAHVAERGGRGEVVHVLMWEAVYIEAISCWQLPGWAVFADPWIVDSE